VDYLVPLGTTGETVTLGADERRAVMDFVVEANAGRVPVMMGLGGNNTAEILRAFAFYDFSGIDAILSVSPYYNRPSQRGIFQHYRMIADESPVPVIAYNVPSRTGSNIDAQTALELAHEVPNLVGIKEASGNLERAMKIIQGKPKDFLVISGDDALTLPMIACGADGLISVIANAFPKETSEMVSSALAGNYDKARKLHYRLLDITNLIFSDGSPSGIKGLLSLQRVCQEHVRMPLVSASKSLMNKMEAVI
jgi:4-hydroxy-tetrahydrodipicolinate synthase